MYFQQPAGRNARMSLVHKSGNCQRALSRIRCDAHGTAPHLRPHHPVRPALTLLHTPLQPPQALLSVRRERLQPLPAHRPQRPSVQAVVPLSATLPRRTSRASRSTRRKAGERRARQPTRRPPSSGVVQSNFDAASRAARSRSPIASFMPSLRVTQASPDD